MKLEDGIQVNARLCGEDGYLTEYDTPSAVTCKTHSESCFIQAKTGRKFEVIVTISAEFDVHSAEYLFIGISTGTAGSPEASISQAWAIRRPSKDIARQYKFTAFLSWEKTRATPTLREFRMPEPDGKVAVDSPRPFFFTLSTDSHLSSPVTEASDKARKGAIFVSFVRGTPRKSYPDTAEEDQDNYDPPGSSQRIPYGHPTIVNRNSIKASKKYGLRRVEFWNIGTASTDIAEIDAAETTSPTSNSNCSTNNSENDEAVAGSRQLLRSKKNRYTRDISYKELRHSKVRAKPSRKRRAPRPYRQSSAENCSEGYYQGDDDEDDEEGDPTIKSKLEIDLTADDDGTTQKVKTGSSIPASEIPDRKRGNGETGTKRSPEEVKKRKKDKKTLELELKQAQDEEEFKLEQLRIKQESRVKQDLVKQKLLEYDDDDDE